MKRFKYLAFLLWMMPLAFGACTDDDNDEITDEEYIAGAAVGRRRNGLTDSGGNFEADCFENFGNDRCQWQSDVDLRSGSAGCR